MTRETKVKASVVIAVLGFADVASRQFTGDSSMGLIGYTITVIFAFLLGTGIGATIGVYVTAVLTLFWIPAAIAAYIYRNKERSPQNKSRSK